jgi:hypothetical protein
MLATSSQLQTLEARLSPLRERLTRHPLYSSIRTTDDLRVFMESHVFAVWDFMSLLKALQKELTCVEAPWYPVKTASGSAESRRFLNAIVLDEESDEFEGRTLSHFELYVEAMDDCLADTQPVLKLLELISRGHTVEEALAGANSPAAAKAFVTSTFAIIRGGRLHEIAAAFTFGREDIIPDMFRGLVRELNEQLSGKLDKLVWYLERHIELDGDDHGPLALRLVEDLCGDDSVRWGEAVLAAERALQARAELWDGILAQMEARRG